MDRASSIRARLSITARRVSAVRRRPGRRSAHASFVLVDVRVRYQRRTCNRLGGARTLCRTMARFCDDDHGQRRRWGAAKCCTGVGCSLAVVSPLRHCSSRRGTPGSGEAYIASVDRDAKAPQKSGTPSAARHARRSGRVPHDSEATARGAGDPRSEPVAGIAFARTRKAYAGRFEAAVRTTLRRRGATDNHRGGRATVVGTSQGCGKGEHRCGRHTRQCSQGSTRCWRSVAIPRTHPCELRSSRRLARARPHGRRRRRGRSRARRSWIYVG